MLGLENTMLWQSFAAKADDQERLMVRNLVEKAIARLDLVRDTFPTYTLHNHVHALNVVKLMDELLGPRVGDITPLEGAILILSAYLHDIGMVFTEQERQDLQAEESFDRFLKQYPEAFVILKESGEVTTYLAEWYCRWVHPERVHKYLAGLEEREVSWGRMPIDGSLGLVCKTHGMDASALRSLDGLGTNFLGQADLVFCAIILRLADILDFDHTRSPDEVYKYMGIGKRETRRTEMSDVEWRKHLSSNGFIFPQAESRSSKYSLKFIASPDHPAVEYDIREFLTVIETEMKNCSSILRYCGDKWRTHILPQSIDREDILSKGYKYGEYRFTLEQDQILSMLMGENLYGDPYVFIRELTQNSIDATRHRMFYEQSKGNSDYRPDPITFSTWTDRDGYQWVRIDDFGMGMDEDLIVNFLLKVGRSYYRSAKFKAEILQYERKVKTDFMPISRFGIGMLSCFVVGDRVEVSTRRMTQSATDSPGLRLSMSGLRAFYTLHDESRGHRPPDMPNKLQDKEAYRKRDACGTSVAVRLDPRRDHTKFNLSDTLNGYVGFPPVPIEIDGQAVGGDYKRMIQNPWTTTIEKQLTEDEMKKVEHTLKLKLSGPITVKLLPLDLTGHSLTPNLTGQGLVGYLDIPGPDRAKIKADDDDESRSTTLSFTNDKNLRASFRYRHEKRFMELRARRDMQGAERRGLEDSRESIVRSLANMPETQMLADLYEDSIRELSHGMYYYYDEYEDKSSQLWIDFEKERNASHDPNHPLFEQAEKLRNQLTASSWRELEDSWELVERTAHDLYATVGGRFADLFYNAMRVTQHGLRKKRSWSEFESEASKIKGFSADVDSLIKHAERTYQRFEIFVSDEPDLERQMNEAERYLDLDLSRILGDLELDVKEHLLGIASGNSHWLSHNGIFVPTRKRNTDANNTYQKFDEITLNSPINGSWFKCSIALQDSLRPDVSLSRDELRALPWNIYSALTIALSRALQSHNRDGQMEYELNVFSKVIGQEYFSLNTILDDPNITDGAWGDEPIIETTSGKMSVKQIQQAIANGQSVVLQDVIRVHQIIHGQPRFIDCCEAAMIQMGLTIEYSPNEEKFIVTGPGTGIREGQKLFPPLFFIPYRGESVLRIGNNPLNLNHPFSQWLIENACRLIEDHPGLFDAIRRDVSLQSGYRFRGSDYSPHPSSEIIAPINSALARLRQINGQIRPPEKLDLKESDCK